MTKEQLPLDLDLATNQQSGNRKAWVRPEISESPVNELTSAGGGTPSTDAASYS